MTTTAPDAGTPAAAATVTATTVTRLDAEKLDCYRVAIEAQALAMRLLAPEHRVLRDQIERASLSVVLNISEGAGRRSRKDKRRHYAIARGSAMEAAAAVHVIVSRGIGDAEACTKVRALYVRVVQMLSKLDSALA
jgi:four helix bundle protein